MSKKNAASQYLASIKLQENLDNVLNLLIEKSPSDPYSFLAKEFSRISSEKAIKFAKQNDKKKRAKCEHIDFAKCIYEEDEEGGKVTVTVKVGVTGATMLQDPDLNKGLSFSVEERNTLSLHGLVPPVVETQTEQEARVMWNMDRKHDPLDKYQFFMDLGLCNTKLFYSTLINNVKDLMPIVYTPTVGQACMEFGHIMTRPRGMYITIHDLGNVEQILRNWPAKKVSAVVFTDGERILGLGDLGAFGMGIPVGKLALYAACAGVNPEECLPVVLDVGTNNEAFLEDPLYFGIREKRHRGEKYDALVTEFLDAGTKVFGPNCILQFEDFANANAYRLLDMHRDNYLTFNDDIQGTAAVTLAGIMSSMLASETTFLDHTFLFYGAGSAGLGIANLVAQAISDECSMTVEEARKKIWLVDSRGLIMKDRPSGGISTEKAPFAHPHAKDKVTDLGEIVSLVGATAIIGVSAQPAVFTERVCGLMARNTPRPIIFPLSNPTSKSECTPQVAYTATDGHCIFASGSPFDSFELKGQTFVPGQGNNAFIFPGLSLGLLAAQATRVPDDLFMTAAKSLARNTSDENRAKGTVFPSIKDIRQISRLIAIDVATKAFEMNLTTKERPDDIEALVNSVIWEPNYPQYKKA